MDAFTSRHIGGMKQDGKSELQFCSEKCLNQYKMNIFCHETQTHLMLHGLNNVSCHEAEKANLITPELWFRSCQSPLNSPTEDTYIGNEHVTPTLLPPPHDREEETEQTEIERSVESNRKATRKRNSFCIRICTKANEKNTNFRTEINKNDDNDIKEPILTIEENEFCQFINNQNHCEVRCTEETAPSRKNFKKYHRLTDVIDGDPYDCQQSDNTFLEKNIYVKNIKDLQEVRERDPLENVLRSSTLFSNSTASAIQCENPFVVKSFGYESNRTKYKKQTRASLQGFSPVRSNQAESSVPLSTTLLPPVTILVPYPIPVPIPIPIPIPITSPIPSKVMSSEQEVSLTPKDTKCENLKYNDSIKSKCSVTHESQLCINANVSTMESSQHSTSAKLSLTLSPPSNNIMNNDNAYSLKHNTKFSRKRNRSNETINREHEDLQLKKRNKFITA
ncbi:uncharacterized protein LOC128882800 isoform X1 [Hylaeus volcanicus]|uniref:uncharacterized protein LOC128882800 isoform X1 n=1 Tax=Hylaeus volcanicus TaxID=313075 RepID=UPI0023B81961|nr:uncharacterized protein LOC128882800 isoform X1 [Hylaeus volcanicus]XP_053990529.1 uncharacterized protein LOC128882800 isoform X1 [Hylaeus volcanicus]XP_053990530.1 uncharacterized protein LOC128882800 isoform X1 [Hylaeus volcanicus]XP_053990531.1 uncharacterized protein LOC128882800 isoform X1 [Hylaeus volcanicus]XP_053990532.1 uncharacterized protein LOC128882800 isoform X1 [Hylaeus volcanicus]XP_053990533.1 uncharacterized protein LOC128882800 isoform X1 [Hylaeus volcanicus]XP_05399053